MKKFLKENMRLFLGVIIGTLASSITAYAVNSYSSNQVRYTSDRSVLAVNDVNSALDELYLSTTLGVPTGTILPLMRTNAPSGYLKCDGAVYNIADYKNLADAIKADFGSYNYFGGNGTTTFAVPDLRGEFLRGTGTNSHENQGSGANVGVHQDGTNHVDFAGSTNNDINFPAAQNGSLGGSGGLFAELKDSSVGTVNASRWTSGGGSGSYTDRAKFFTSRPTNTSVLYVIKY